MTQPDPKSETLFALEQIRKGNKRLMFLFVLLALILFAFAGFVKIGFKDTVAQNEQNVGKAVAFIDKTFKGQHEKELESIKNMLDLTPTLARSYYDMIAGLAFFCGLMFFLVALIYTRHNVRSIGKVMKKLSSQM